MSSEIQNSEFCLIKRHSDTQESFDCVIIVENKRFLSHKRILATGSPVFEKMFYGLMPSDEIIISDIAIEEFSQMLNFLYKHKIEIKTIHNAWLLVYVASKYLIDSLVSLCVEYIENDLKLSVMLLNYEYSEMYTIEKLQKRCLKEIINYTKGIFETDYHIKSTTWWAILDQTSLNIEEKELINFATAWAVDECILQDIECTKDNIWKILCENDIAGRLQFVNVHPQDYYAFSDLFYEDELDLITHLPSAKQKYKPLLLKHINETFNRDVIKFPKERQNRFLFSCYKLRVWYKIYKNFRLSSNDMLTTVVSVNCKVALFGIAVGTEHEPCDAVSKSYVGGFTVEIFKDKGSNLMLVDKIKQPFSNLKYDSVTYIVFSKVVILEAHAHYIIGVRYNNLLKDKGIQVLCHYFGNIEKNSIVFTFSNELSGSALRGLSFYPV